MNKTEVVAIAGTLAAAAAVAISVAPAGSAAPANPSSTSAVSATYFALIDRNGIYLAGSGIAGVTHISTGRYQIKAITSLTDCAATGTVIGDNASDPGSGTQSIFLNDYSGSLFVRTSTPGAPGSRSVDDDRSFSIIIVC